MLDREISEFMQKLRDTFEERRTRLPAFEPLLAGRSDQWTEFVRSLRISSYRKLPSTMIDTFRGDEEKVILRAQLDLIFNKGRHTLLQNVSGSGKTSLLFEGLRRHWGLYFVGAVDSWAIGSCDVSTITDFLDDASQSSRMETLKIPLLVRLLAFEAFAQIVDVAQATEEDRELWLLVQACWQDYIKGGDQYAILSTTIYSQECLDISAEIDKTIARIRVLTRDPDFHFFCVVDEAQALAYDVKSWGLDGTSIISPHRNLSQSWENYPWLTLIMSGTIIPRHCYRDTGYRTVSATGSFDQSQAASYIRGFLPSSCLSSASGRSLLWRAGAWLRGRHRFSGAFVVLFLENGLDAPHSLLDDFISTMTGFRPSDAQHWIESEATPYDVAHEVFFPLRTLDAYSEDSIRRSMHHVIYKYLVTGTCLREFDTTYIALVENAAGHFCDDSASRIVVDEPLCIVSAAKWLCEAGNDGLFSLDLIRSAVDPSTSSMREYIVLLLAYALNDARPLSDVVCGPGTAHAWTKDTVELVELHRSPDGVACVFYPFKYQHLSSARPVALAADCTSYSDVLTWLRHERTSPFCLLPDQKSLLFALRFSNGTFCWVVAQTSLEPAGDFTRCFYPPASIPEDASQVFALLSRIPAPCDSLGSPPILRVTISSPSATLRADEFTLDMACLESTASVISPKDVLLRIVANVIRVAEPHAPNASELLKPEAVGPPSTPGRRAGARSPRRSRKSWDKSPRPPEQTRYDLRPRRQDSPPLTSPTGPITRSMAMRGIQPIAQPHRRIRKRASLDEYGLRPQKPVKRPRTVA
ncbi:hypothetical protein EV122DRAFT_221360 [Schizophyllum commune]